MPELDTATRTDLHEGEALREPGGITVGLITTADAATRLGIPLVTLDDWVKRGLLTVHQGPPTTPTVLGVCGLLSATPCVDEDQLYAVADSLGWLQLSAGALEGSEDE